MTATRTARRTATRMAAVACAALAATACAVVAPRTSDDLGSLASRAPAGTGAVVTDPSCDAAPADCSDAAAAADNSIGIVAKKILRPIRLSRVGGRGLYRANMLLNGNYASAIEDVDGFLAGQGFRLTSRLDGPVLAYVGEDRWAGYQMTVTPSPGEVVDNLLPVAVAVTAPA